MAQGLGSLKGILNRHVEKVKKQAHEIKREVARTVLRDLTERTPVDTGKAISNWLVGINEADEGNIPPHVPGWRGSTLEDNTEMAYDLGDAVINLAISFEDVIYIGNEGLDSDGNYEYLSDFNYEIREYRTSLPPQQRPYREFFEAAVAEGLAKKDELISLDNKVNL